MTDKQQHNDHLLATSTADTSLTASAPYLDHTQQHLLLAALNSQASQRQNSLANSESAARQGDKSQMSSLQDFGDMTANPLDPDFTPDMYDYDLDDSFDFDNADLGGQMIGGMPDADHHEKRKISDADSEDGGDAKRQETQEGEKGPKKPGRKPLTNEPTTKRKAQNRAAQRAFRERKEKHLKDLETQVSDLTKASEADKHENGLLRAQVEKLQSELREYRKSLSLNSSAVSRSPPLSAMQSQSTRNQLNFNFDFPKFGSLPSAQVLSNSNITPPLSNNSPTSTSFGQRSGQYSRQGSEAQSMSPLAGSNTQSPARIARPSPPIDTTSNLTLFSTNDNMHGFADTLPQMGRATNDPLNDLFSPSILKTLAQNQPQSAGYFNNSVNKTTETHQPNTSSTAFDANNGGDSTAGIPDHRVFRFNSQSAASNSASPSASSSSQWNNNTTNSSCGTSPEPAVDSPAINSKPTNAVASQEPQTTQYDFSQTNASNSGNDLNLTPFDSNSFNVPQLDTFDPVLFGDYRDTTNNVLGNGDFTGGFFDDSFGTSGLDLGSPSNLFGILASTPTNSNQIAAATTPSRALMEEIEKARDGGDDDFGLPNTNLAAPSQATQEQRNPKTGKLVSCTSIWNQLQSNPDFQEGKFDLDGLCAELRTKARCSESGLMVESDHVDAALKKVMENGGPTNDPKKLYFEQSTWDSILSKRMNASKQS